jgi:hypothetical protein
MPGPVVTKKYCEDVAEPDADGVLDFEYRYWAYWFDFGDRRYRARIYVDQPDDASVMLLTRPKPPQYEDDLRIIAAHLRADAAIHTVSTLHPVGGFVPVIVFE